MTLRFSCCAHHMLEDALCLVFMEPLQGLFADLLALLVVDKQNTDTDAR
jgi:hypothetical protein